MHAGKWKSEIIDSALSLCVCVSLCVRIVEHECEGLNGTGIRRARTLSENLLLLL